MDKRYQVFVSSTYDDLREERHEVIQALLELECIPAGMELFPAADEDQWALIRRVINDCDYYVVVIAGRYGSIGVDGKSFTQMEYEYALETKKPIIAFLHNDPGKILAEKTDPPNYEKLNTFRKVAQKKMCKFWATPHELGSVVSRSLINLIKQKPGIGWVRADSLPDINAATELLRLRAENDDLRRALERARVEAPEGSEAYAFGDEEIDLHFDFQNTDFDARLEIRTVTWNRIFALLGPLMIDGASEAELAGAMGEFFRNSVADRLGRHIFYPGLRDEDFQKIKVQFRALGLITKDDRPQFDKEVGTRWILTPYGDTVLIRSAAIPSQNTF